MKGKYFELDLSEASEDFKILSSLMSSTNELLRLKGDKLEYHSSLLDCNLEVNDLGKNIRQSLSTIEFNETRKLLTKYAIIYTVAYVLAQLLLGGGGIWSYLAGIMILVLLYLVWTYKEYRKIFDLVSADTHYYVRAIRKEHFANIINEFKSGRYDVADLYIAIGESVYYANDPEVIPDYERAALFTFIENRDYKSIHKMFSKYSINLLK